MRCAGQLLGQLRSTPPPPRLPRVSKRLLDSLNLLPMDGESSETLSMHSARSDASGATTASTVTCSTEGSCCLTP